MNRVLLLALPLLLAGCPDPANHDATAAPSTAAPTTNAASEPAAELSRFHWRLQDARDAQGKRIDALFVRADAPLQLDFDAGRINVGNACNRMGGSVAIKGDALDIGRMQSTLMACADPKLTALDGEIGKRLEGVSTFTLLAFDTPTLTLKNAAGDALAFAGEPTAETRYGGPGERVFLEVAAQTKPCSHPLIRDMQCLQVREIRYDDKGLKTGTPGAFGNYYGAIEGYTHQPGVRNVLRVKRFRIANPPADGASQADVLDMVVESDASGK